jgi:hypothetical protein
MSKPAKRSKPKQEPGIVWPTHERMAMSGFVEARTFEFEPANEGSAVRKPIRTIRDLNATAAGRLSKLGLNRQQLMAANLFEQDHETARLEPRMTANMTGGGGRVEDMANRVLEARDKKHNAMNALRLAGPTAVRVVEDVVLNSITVTTVGGVFHANRMAAKAWAQMALEIGLNLLAAHYVARGRMTLDA